MEVIINSTIDPETGLISLNLTFEQYEEIKRALTAINKRRVVHRELMAKNRGYSTKTKPMKNIYTLGYPTTRAPTLKCIPIKSVGSPTILNIH